MKRGLFSDLKKNAEGSTAIEFAVLAPVFFLLVFLILETAILFMAEVTLSNAVRKTAREIRLGNPVIQTESELREIACPLVATFFDCESLTVDLRQFPSFDAVSVPPMVDEGEIVAEFEPSESNVFMTLRMAYEWPTVTQAARAYLANREGGKHLIIAGTFFKSEPF